MRLRLRLRCRRATGLHAGVECASATEMIDAAVEAMCKKEWQEVWLLKGVTNCAEVDRHYQHTPSRRSPNAAQFAARLLGITLCAPRLSVCDRSTLQTG